MLKFLSKFSFLIEIHNILRFLPSSATGLIIDLFIPKT
nr:MAG TPA: hypothetical protein [Bacteriophage sp.]